MTNWQNNENSMFNLIKKIPQFNDLKRTSEFASADCINQSSVVEMKYRSPAYNHYDEILFETDKMNRIKQTYGSKDIWYANALDKGIYIWNMSDLLRNNYDFKKTTQKCKKTTNFNNRKKVRKDVGFVHRDAAALFIDYQGNWQTVQ